MALVDVRLTINPDKPVRIHEGDVPQLAHQGLISGEPVPVPGEEPRGPGRRRPPRKPRPALPSTTDAGPSGENEGTSS